MTQLQKMHKLHRTKSAPSSSRVPNTPPPLPGPSILRNTYTTFDMYDPYSQSQPQPQLPPLPPNLSGLGESMGVGVSVSFAPLPETETFGRRGKLRLGVIARSEILNKQRQRRRDGRSSAHADFDDEPALPLSPITPQQLYIVESQPADEYEHELNAKMSKMSLVGDSRRRLEQSQPQTQTQTHLSHSSPQHSTHQHSQISFKFWKRTGKRSNLSSAEERNEPAPQFGSRQPAPDHDNHVAPANPVLSRASYEKSLHNPAADSGDQSSKDSSTPSTPKRPELSIPHGTSDHTSPLVSEIALITYSVATVTNPRHSISSFQEPKQHLDNLQLVAL